MDNKSDMSNMAIVQRTEQPRTSPPGSKASEHMPKNRSCVFRPGCSASRAIVTGAARCVLSELEKLLKWDS